LAAMGHDVHIVTRSEIDQAEFYHDGVMVHRVKVGSAWYQLNRITRYQLTTTVYLLGLSTAIQRSCANSTSKRPSTPAVSQYAVLWPVVHSLPSSASCPPGCVVSTYLE
jgi:hypothetical protein